VQKVISKIKKNTDFTKRGTTVFENPEIISEFTEHDNEPPGEQRLKLLVGEVLKTKPYERTNEQLEILSTFFKRFTFFTDLLENHSRPTLMQVLRLIKLIKVEADQNLIEQGEVGDKFFVVMKG
jgi:hypothetical protein